MHSTGLDKPLTQHQVRCLLDELCIDLGFCLPPADAERLAKDHPLNAREFADAIYRAEGMDLETRDLGLWRRVRDRIQVHFDAT